MEENNCSPMEVKPTAIPLIIGGIIVAVSIILGVFFIGRNISNPSRLYNEAVKSYQEGDYKQAYSKFVELDDLIGLEYKNSIEIYNDCAYKYASELVESNDNFTARFILFGEEHRTNLVESDYGNSRALGLKVAQIGDTVYFGNYNGAPLEWIVADDDEGNLCLVAKEIVERKEYDDYEGDKDYITWQNSSLRQWLNSSFYEQAFLNAQKKAIVNYYDDINDCYDYVSLPSNTNISVIYNYYKDIVSDDIWLYSYNYSDSKNVIEHKKIDTSNYFGTFGVKPTVWIDTHKVTEV